MEAFLIYCDLTLTESHSFNFSCAHTKFSPDSLNNGCRNDVLILISLFFIKKSNYQCDENILFLLKTHTIIISQICIAFQNDSTSLYSSGRILNSNYGLNSKCLGWKWQTVCVWPKWCLISAPSVPVSHQTFRERNCILFWKTSWPSTRLLLQRFSRESRQIMGGWWNIRISEAEGKGWSVIMGQWEYKYPEQEGETAMCHSPSGPFFSASPPTWDLRWAVGRDGGVCHCPLKGKEHIGCLICKTQSCQAPC